MYLCSLLLGWLCPQRQFSSFQLSASIGSKCFSCLSVFPNKSFTVTVCWHLLVPCPPFVPEQNLLEISAVMSEVQRRTVATSSQGYIVYNSIMSYHDEHGYGSEPGYEDEDNHCYDPPDNKETLQLNLQSASDGHTQSWEQTLKSGRWSDVTFLLGAEKEEFKVHRLVLRNGSKVFDELFNTNNDKISFDVPDLEPNEFNLLLKYFYTGKCTENIEEALALLKAATKYEVQNLINLCVELVGGGLTEDNSLKVFQQALKYNDVDLSERALESIGSFARKLIKSPAFLELSIEELTKIVASDALEIPNEVDLFEAVMNWARAECKRQNCLETHKYLRSILENVIPLIRFPLMNSTDFALKVSPTNVLLMEEVVSILMYFSVKQEDRESIPPGIFNTKSRARYLPTGSNLVLKRLVKSQKPVIDLVTGISTGKTYLPASGLEHSIRVKSNSSIWITSFGINSTFPPAATGILKCTTQGCTYGEQYAGSFTCRAGHGMAKGLPDGTSSDSLTVKTQIKDDNQTMAVKTENIRGVTSQITQVRHISFNEPVYLRKGEWYTLSFAVISGDFYGNQYTAENGVGTSLDFKLTDGSERVVKFEFRNENNTKYTGVTQGFIPEIGFMVE